MATWARRDFLRLSTVVITAGVSAGCVSEVSGTPRALPGDSGDGPDDDPDVTSTESSPGDLVRVAVFADSEPDSYEDDSGEIVGQVPEVARAVLERLAVADVEFLVIREPEQGIAMLQVGEVDLIGGMAVRQETCERLAFSAPDHVLRDALLVPVGNPKGLKTYAEIVATGAKVAVLPGEGLQRATRAGVPAGQIVELGHGELVPAIASGSIDCAVYLEVVIRALADGSGGTAEATPPFTAPGQDPVIIAFAFGQDSDLVEDFSTSLVELQESGEWARISGRYGYDADDLPGPESSVEKVCAR